MRNLVESANLYEKPNPGRRDLIYNEPTAKAKTPKWTRWNASLRVEESRGGGTRSYLPTTSIRSDRAD